MTRACVVGIGALALSVGAAQAQADSGRPRYSAADVQFMAGMIAHHAQAVLIAGWAPAHGASPALRALCERIVVGQRDEIAIMQRWLEERHQAVPDSDPRRHPMPGMDHPRSMPGMLTPAQLAQLDAARGSEFDRLFLTFMIQHHRGALTMVRALVDTPGAARDGPLFQIASDVSADQTTEIDRNPGAFGFLNSDLAFTGHYVIQGNFHGLQVWDIAQPSHPTLVTSYVCPDAQNDVSVYRNLLFTSGEDFNGRLDCGTQGVPDSVSKDRMRGIRIFDISDIAHPKPITSVQTCRGSHTHTVVTDPNDSANIYIYVSGSAPVRSPNELAGCSDLTPDKDPNSERFRIEVIQVPLAHPEQAHVVSKPAILADLAARESHGDAPEDIAAAAKAAADARAKGGVTATIRGTEIVVGARFVAARLDSIVKARGGSGAPTGADSAALRAGLQAIVDRIVNPPTPANAL